MTSELRAVADSNILVSAALVPNSSPRRVVDLVMQNGRLLFSELTLMELDDVLRRPKFDRYLAKKLRLEFLASLVNEAEIVSIGVEISECRDPDDNRILEAAVSGNASDIVTGDGDLLALIPFRGIAILTATSFLEKWRP